MVSGYALKKNSIGLFKVTKDKEAVPSRKGNAVSSYSFIFFLGLSLGLATAILFNLFPDILGGKLHAIVNTDGKMMIVGVLLVSALLSWPMSSVVNRYGMAPTFWISLAGIIVSTASIFVLDSAAAVFILAIIFSIAFTSLSVSSLPLAIKHSGWSEKVFCVGIFFSGVAVPEAIWQSWLAWL